MFLDITGLGSAADFYVMNSSADADKVIALFESAIAQGYHPAAVETEIYKQAEVNPTNFTEFDKQRILLKVNEIWESMMNNGRKF